MREELKEIELIDKYLNNDLSEQEKADFEKRLQEDPELSQAVQDQIDLRSGLERIQLNKEINSIIRGKKGGGFGKFMGPVVVLIIAVAAVFLINKKEAITSPQETIVENQTQFESTDNPSVSREKNIKKDKKEKHSKKRNGKLFKKYDVELQKFIITNNEESTITGKDGTVITFPADAFSVDGRIEISLKEYLKPADIVLCGLSTRSGDHILETGGMIDIRAYSNGKEIALDEEASYEISFPETPNPNAQYKTFYASRNDSTVNWNVDPNYVFSGLEFISTINVNDRARCWRNTGRKAGDRYGNHRNNRLVKYMSSFIFSDEDLRYLSTKMLIPGVRINMQVEGGKLKSTDVITQSNYLKSRIGKHIAEMAKLDSFPKNDTTEYNYWIEGAFGYYPDERIPLAAEQSKLNQAAVKSGAKTIYAVNLGLVNCDAYLEFWRELKSIRVTNTFKGVPMMVFKSQNGYVDPNRWKSGVYEFMGVPEGLSVIMIIYKQIGKKKYKVAIKEFEIGEEEVHIGIEQIMTEDELVSTINSIKT